MEPLERRLARLLDTMCGELGAEDAWWFERACALVAEFVAKDPTPLYPDPGPRD